MLHCCLLFQGVVQNPEEQGWKEYFYSDVDNLIPRESHLPLQKLVLAHVAEVMQQVKGVNVVRGARQAILPGIPATGMEFRQILLLAGICFRRWNPDGWRGCRQYLRYTREYRKIPWNSRFDLPPWRSELR